VIRPTVLSKHDTTRLQGAIPSTPPVLGLRRECFENVRSHITKET
jgi:hypothetical protein